MGTRKKFIAENVKLDCFGYNEKENNCHCLKELYCGKEKCSFYKKMTSKQKEKFYEELKAVLITDYH